VIGLTATSAASVIRIRMDPETLTLGVPAKIDRKTADRNREAALWRRRILRGKGSGVNLQESLAEM